MEFKKAIGLEVHIELSTSRKLFCNCNTRFGARPNSQSCNICLGRPGAMPILSRKAVDYAILAGLALNLHISDYMSFDRKAYYYPDLPKAYQITQYYQPIGVDGYIDIETNKGPKRVRIKRLHLEEDAGKLIHQPEKQITKVDYNRAGIPLIEVVTEPDLNTAEECQTFLEQLRLIALYLGISDCKMEEGSLRCDVNISLNSKDSKLHGTRVEIKNLNSFKAIQKALEYEFERQREILVKGSTIVAETRRWNDKLKKTESMKKRDRGDDYRYMPDPELPTIRIGDKRIKHISFKMPELPATIYKRFRQNYCLSEKDARLLLSIPDLARLFEACLLEYNKPQVLCNWLTGDLLRLIKESNTDIKSIKLSPMMIKDLLIMIDNGLISTTIARKVFIDMFYSGHKPQLIVERKKLAQVTDQKTLEAVTDLVLKQNKSSVSDYKAGKKKVLSYLMGQAMEKTEGKANPVILKEILTSRLDQSKS